MIRLQKIIAQTGIASRRMAEQLIISGRVSVNGKKVITLGTQADPDTDKIAVDGKLIKRKQSGYRYIVLHKPTGYVSTKARFPNQRSVYDLVPHSNSLALAGRLDKESSGVLLFTDDGDLIYQLTHPSFTHAKIYDVLINRSLTQQELLQLKKGVRLEEGVARLDDIKQIGASRYRLVIHQGWKRQIRRMMQKMDAEVRVLQRIQLANIKLGSLPTGKWIEVRRQWIVGGAS